METTTGEPMAETTVNALHVGVGAAFAGATAACTMIACCKQVYRRLRRYAPAAAAGTAVVAAAAAGQLSSVVSAGDPPRRGNAKQSADNEERRAPEDDVRPAGSSGAGVSGGDATQDANQERHAPGIACSGRPTFQPRYGPWRHIMEVCKKI